MMFLATVSVVAGLLAGCGGNGRGTENKAAKEAAEEKTEERAAEKRADKADAAKAEIKAKVAKIEQEQKERFEEFQREKAEKSVPPPTLKGRIKAAVVKGAVRPEEYQTLVQGDGAGCKYVTVNHTEAENWAGDPDAVTRNMQEVYSSIYSDGELAGSVCSVTINAFGDLIDSYGNRNNEEIYSTTLDRATADKINWSAPYDVDFPSVWTTNRKHPAVEQAEGEEQLKEAADCLVDNGLFDIDIGC